MSNNQNLMLAFDTANESIAIGVGVMDAQARTVTPVATREVEARRASNTKLLPEIDALFVRAGLAKGQIACVCVGRGPGSFTGVRIAMATAKGVASALGVALVGVDSLDAVAWAAALAGHEGQLLVVADAMRKEVYPAFYVLSAAGGEGAAGEGAADAAGGPSLTRLTPTRVVKAAAFAEELAAGVQRDLLLTGDALAKYADAFVPAGRALDAGLWRATGAGLLAAAQASWQRAEIDPFDAAAFAPGKLLPVYTRLSDAEETERARLAAAAAQADAADGWKAATPKTERSTMHATSHVGEMKGATADGGVVFRPLDAPGAVQVARLEAQCMGSDAWSANLVADELSHANRVWWQAVDAQGTTCAYAGGLIVDGEVQILKVATDPARRRGRLATELMRRVIEDARNLGTSKASLEVRASNAGAIAFYERLGFAHVGVRPRYYSDGENACIMAAHIDDLQFFKADGAYVTGAGCGTPSPKSGEGAAAGAAAVAEVGGMSLQNQAKARSSAAAPLILAIETSCDETAAAVINGEGALLSDVVASQVDFHARFGGVVPEIASRKHTEAICGVCDAALESAAQTLEGAAGAGAAGAPTALSYKELDAVAVTYAPGLVGALVVGVAFAKGVAWAADLPLVGVNHLEGHLYANKLATLDGGHKFAPPAVVSLVSGGNTMLVHMKDWGQYEVLGTTIDDAVGEAFDKVAKALGLPYPGGPHISRLAEQGNAQAIAFPRAMMHSGDLRFSLSGLKTAVTSYINQQRASGLELNLPDICASFQAAVVDVQVKKAQMALEQTRARTFCLGGGVAANPALRAAYETMCKKRHVTLVMPPLKSCGDNAGMIALVALDRFCAGKFMGLDADAQAHADISEEY